MPKTIALLDRPSRLSMSAVPVVIQHHEAAMPKVYGLAKAPGSILQSEALNELLRSRQALQLVGGESKSAAMCFARDGNSNPVAMWIGDDFERRAGSYGLPTEIIAEEFDLEAAGGKALVAPPEEVFARLQIWLEKALHTVLESGKDAREVATLMCEVIPDDKLTRTALYFSARDDSEREAELSWFRKVDRDSRRPTNQKLTKLRLSELKERYKEDIIKKCVVTAVIGRSGSQHGEMAKIAYSKLAARRVPVTKVSFGGYLRELRASANKSELQDLGQRLVEERPFHFARSVIDRKKAGRYLIVDGLRHLRIYKALSYMFEKVHVLMVDATEEEVKRRLSKEVGSAADVESVRSHATEKALEELIRQVPTTYKIPHDGSRTLEHVAELYANKFIAA